MITASEARKQTEAFTPKPRKWNIFDTLQFKRIERSIKFWSARGDTSIVCGNLRTLVYDKLKENGYKIESHGAADQCWFEIHW